jgi:hypothetical protein
LKHTVLLLSETTDILINPKLKALSRHQNKLFQPRLCSSAVRDLDSHPTILSTTVLGYTVFITRHQTRGESNYIV